MKKHFLSFILLALTLGWSANALATTTIYVKRADATNLVIQYDSNSGWIDYYNDLTKVVKQCDAGWFMYTTSDQMTNAIHIRRKNNEKDWNLSNEQSNISDKTTYWILNDNGDIDYTPSSATQYNTDCGSTPPTPSDPCANCKTITK